MEENNILNNNEEEDIDEYESIELTETENEVTYDETIQMVEIEEPESYEIGSDSAFPALGAQNELLNHSLLNNRDGADQHPIVAITGLREELDGIHALKTVESNKVGMANYYKWGCELNTLPSPADRVGLFVSVHTVRNQNGKLDNKIEVCNETDDVYGVVVDSAAFVGGQDETVRDDSYCLVATTGVVRVQCEQTSGANTVVPGDYVMSSHRGFAKKTPRNVSGFYVISIDQVGDKKYAVISLSSIMNQVYNLSADVVQCQDDIKTVEHNATAAVNAVDGMLREMFEQGISLANQNSQTALNNSNIALGYVDNFRTDIGTISTKVDAVADSVVTAEQVAQAIATSELTQDIIDTIQDDFNDDLDEIRETTENALAEARALKNSIYGDYPILETWGNAYNKDPSKIYYVSDEQLYYYFDIGTNQWKTTDIAADAGLLEVIVNTREKSDENEAYIESLTSYSGRDYDVLEEWDGREEISNWVGFTPIDNNIIYYDTNTSLYHWYEDNNWTSSEYPLGDSSKDDFVEKNTSKVYYAEDTGLYYYYSDYHWHTTIIPSVADLVKSIALTRQKSDANEARIDNIVEYGADYEAIAAINQRANRQEAEIDLLASYSYNDYQKIKNDTWQEWDGVKDPDIVYYAEDGTNNTWKYWYYDTNQSPNRWVGTTNPTQAGLSSSIANIETKVSENESRINSITTWQGGVNTSIANIEQVVGPDGAKIESLVFNLNAYSVGRYSQAYGLSVADAKELLSNGTVFVPTENGSESYINYKKLDEYWDNTDSNLIQGNIYYAQDHSDEDKWKYWQYDTNVWTGTTVAPADSVYSQNFNRGSYYVWNTSLGRWTDYQNGVLFSSYYVLGSNSTPYLVTNKSYAAESTDVQQLNGDVLYHWNNGAWEKVATVGTNTLGRAISQIQQTTGKISASVNNVSGDLANLELRVDDIESVSVSSTAFYDKMTEIEQSSSENEARLSLLVSKGVSVKNVWNENDTDINTSKVYYETTNERYYYHNGTNWVYTNDVNDPNVASKIHSAGIIASINDDTSSIKIDASKIDITGSVTFITPQDLSGESTTNINGSNITTGCIKSNNYVSGNPIITNNDVEWDESNKYTSRVYFNTYDELYHYYNNGWTTSSEINGVILEIINSSVASGMIINLNNGSLYAPNFRLAPDGDISIADSIELDSEGNISLTGKFKTLKYNDRDYEILDEWNGYEEIDNWEEFTPIDNNIIYYDTSTSLYYWYDDNDWTSSEYPLDDSERDDFEEKDPDQIYYAADTDLYYYYDDGHGWRTTTSLFAAGLVDYEDISIEIDGASISFIGDNNKSSSIFMFNDNTSDANLMIRGNTRTYFSIGNGIGGSRIIALVDNHSIRPNGTSSSYNINLGSTNARWNNIYGINLDISDDITCGSLSADTINVTTLNASNITGSSSGSSLDTSNLEYISIKDSTHWDDLGDSYSGDEYTNASTYDEMMDDLTLVYHYTGEDDPYNELVNGHYYSKNTGNAYITYNKIRLNSTQAQNDIVELSTTNFKDRGGSLYFGRWGNGTYVDGRMYLDTDGIVNLNAPFKVINSVRDPDYSVDSFIKIDCDNSAYGSNISFNNAGQGYGVLYMDESGNLKWNNDIISGSGSSSAAASKDFYRTYRNYHFYKGQGGYKIESAFFSYQNSLTGEEYYKVYIDFYIPYLVEHLADDEKVDHPGWEIPLDIFNDEFDIRPATQSSYFVEPYWETSSDYYLLDPNVTPNISLSIDASSETSVGRTYMVRVLNNTLATTGYTNDMKLHVRFEGNVYKE